MSPTRPQRIGARSIRIVALALALGGGLPGQPDLGPNSAPDEGRFLNVTVPDVPLECAGRPVRRLAELGREGPVLLTFVFSRCVLMCSPFLDSFVKAIREIGGRNGKIQMVVVSFDPRDTPEDMAVLAGSLGVAQEPTWTFATTRPAELLRLADAVGFWFRWDERSRQYDHPAMVAGIVGGRCVRLLLGASVQAARLREVVEELRGDCVPFYPLPGRVAFRCFQYDRSGDLTLDWGILLLALPCFAALAIAGWIFWRPPG